MMAVRGCIIAFWVMVVGIALATPRALMWLRPSKSINIFAWSNMIDRAILKEFERETGAIVYLSYYETNEELLAKLKLTGGRGYDLIIPSDYAVQSLIADGALKKIDKSKLDFMDRIHPKLLGHYYDPRNEYSIPYFWSIYGLAIDTDYFGKVTPPASWDLIFGEQLPYSVVMLEEAREVVLVAAQYLFGSVDELDAQQLQAVRELLRAQRKHVVAYTSSRGDHLLLAKSAPVVVLDSAEAALVMQHNEAVDFLVPREGGFLLIDNLVIPQASEHEELVYELMNFLFRRQIIEHHVKDYPFLPVTKDMCDVVPHTTFCQRVVQPALAAIERFSFFRSLLSDRQLNQLWISVKAS